MYLQNHLSSILPRHDQGYGAGGSRQDVDPHMAVQGKSSSAVSYPHVQEICKFLTSAVSLCMPKQNQFSIAPMHMALSIHYIDIDSQFTISLLIPISPTHSLHNCDFSHQANWFLHAVSSHILLIYKRPLSPSLCGLAFVWECSLCCLYLVKKKVAYAFQFCLEQIS